MQLIIDQIWGRIGIGQTPPDFRLEISDPKLNLDIKCPVLTVKHDRVELSIDAKACREDLHQYEPLDFSRYYAERAWEKVIAAIARFAGEGDRLGAIETGEVDVIANIARENSLESDVDLELVAAHLPSIKFRIIKGDKDFQEGRVAVDLEYGRARVNLVWGHVSTYMRQPPELRIRAVGSLLDTRG